MYNLTPQLLSYLASTLKVGDSEPKVLVRVFDPQRPGTTIDFSEFGTELLSVDLDRRWDMIASEATIKIFDRDGMYSPDYHSDKFLPDIQLPQQNNTFRYVFWPNTKIEVYAGYGEILNIMFTGLIDKVEINSEAKELTFKCRGMTKDLLTTIIDPATPTGKYEYVNWVASDVFADMVTKLGLVVDYNTTKYYDTDLAKEIEYFCPVVTFNFGELYGDALQKFVETLYHRMYDTRWGHVKLEQIIMKTQQDVEDYTYDDTINIQNLNYTIDDAEVRTHIRIVGPGGVNTYVNDYLFNLVCRGKKRLMSVTVPWADTESKRALAAKYYFTQIMRKLRTISIGAPGNPALDVGDLLRMRDLVSTATAKYQVVGIRTSITDMGYFDVIDVEYASSISSVKVAFTGENMERVEKLVFVESFYNKNIQSNWDATFDAANPVPWQVFTTQVTGTNKTWGYFHSTGPLVPGDTSDAILDIVIPDNGHEYELQFQYCIDGNTMDGLHFFVNNDDPIIVHGWVPWRKSQRHKLKPGANRIIWRFKKNDAPQTSHLGAPYSRMMINWVAIYKIGYR